MVVGIGACAGGLEACNELVAALPAGSGIAAILVQPLHPTHESMMVDLLSVRSALTVCQASEGMPIEPEHLYIIQPGVSLSVAHGALHVEARDVRPGEHLPFDRLLLSLAEAYGPRAACVVLSGTGADGSAGLLAIREKGGFVVAQLPAEAHPDGMPTSATSSRQVDLIAPAASIPGALLARMGASATPAPAAQPWLAQIIELLRTGTVHDFSLYKPGTLGRRVERRMATAPIRPKDMGAYLQTLRGDRTELDLLAKDLLINVTGFFRDPAVFDMLAATIIPDLVARHAPDRPLRIWVAGCSTGEETYSIAMLFQEWIAKSGRPIKLQVFASDVDADAVLAAREGVYPDAAVGSLAPERLARFFSQEDGRWRVHPDLRATIVFTVQDVLADPPFSRLDMVSCRNLLIYLQPDAQAKVLSQFHWALRKGGILLLGSAETAGIVQGLFDVVAKRERIYRRTGLTSAREARDLARAGPRPSAVAELGRRLVIDAYAPASLLINAANDILFSLGPVDRYLRLAPGHATHDVLAMARADLRAKLHTAIQAARQTDAPASAACRITVDGKPLHVTVEVRPVLEWSEAMLLVSFVQAQDGGRLEPPLSTGDLPRIAELERELETTRSELGGMILTLEQSGEEQRAINEETLSVNEEYQSTNEEQLASKEELQSLNEELTALNSQLQQTLERQRTTSDDLQNVLYSTNVATVFLDRDLCIRFFTPATTSLFSVIASDIGRKLSNFAAMAPESGLEADARAVLDTLHPKEREIEAKDGVWYRRRILPYRTHGDRVGGVVITFTDITARMAASKALEIAKRQADTANAAKSRFLAAASHDLRQPLQTLSLLQALLAQAVEGDRAGKLVERLDDTLAAMKAMLDTLLDINEIEAGAVHAQMGDFAIDGLLERIRGEFSSHAQAKGLALRVVPSTLTVRSDPGLLEQMVRNLVSNALKYTTQGRVLLGCRRRDGAVSVEVWDTGIGIPEAEWETIFEEYYQLGNAARERSRGLGLGLAVVRQLGGLLDHPVRVHSRPGVGSGFSIAVPLVRVAEAVLARRGEPAGRRVIAAANRSAGRAILLVEDDPDVRDLLALLLESEGYQVTKVPDGPAAIDAVQDQAPDLVLADHNLPNSVTGLELAGRIRRRVGADLPVIILTGDISTATQRDVTGHGCTLLNKPVKRGELLSTVERLLSPTPASSPAAVRRAATDAVVFVVDDDIQVRRAMGEILEQDGRTVQVFATSEAFLEAYRPGGEACLLVDAYLPGMDGFELLAQLSGHSLPAIMITGHSDVRMAVRAMKAGASDFIEKPVCADELLTSVGRALEQARDTTKRSDWQAAAVTHLAGLTTRQREVMQLVLAGHPSKNIAADLGISQRTVENHRASVMRKTGAGSLPALARLAMAAVPDGAVQDGSARDLDGAPGTVRASM